MDGLPPIGGPPQAPEPEKHPFKEPLAHIVRRVPPWREPDKTECGRPLSDVVKYISRDEAKALIKKHGVQRAAFLLCVTCVHTSDRYRDWGDSPSDVVGREGTSRWEPGHSLMDRELFAIAALIEAHRDEFDGFLAGLGETVSLTDRRAAKAYRRGRTR